MIRECPVCHVPLNRVRLQSSLEIDFCLSCEGLWSNKNELTQVYKSGPCRKKCWKEDPILPVIRLYANHVARVIPVQERNVNPVVHRSSFFVRFATSRWRKLRLVMY